MHPPSSAASEGHRPELPAQGLLRDRALWALLGAAALLRGILLASFAAFDPLLSVLHSDPQYYDAWARAALAGTDFHGGRPYWLPPLYPWLLGGLYGMTGGSLAATLAVQAALGLSTTAAVVVLAGRVAGRRAGLAAGWLWTLYGPAVFLESRLLGENVALPLCLAALLAGVFALERADAQRAAWPWALAAGLAAGLAALARPNLLLCLPGAGLGAWWSLRRAGRAPAARVLLSLGLAAGSGLGLGVLPGALGNHARSGQWVLVSANGGINLWFGNNPQARGTFHAPGPEWGAIAEQRLVSLGLAAAELGREVDEVEASRHWAARARAWMLEDPGRAALLWARKLADNLSSTEFDVQYVYAEIRRQVGTLWLAPLPFGLLLGLAALGLGRVRHGGALLGWIAAGLAASLLYFTYSRFRLPWLPALLPFAAVGALRIGDALRGRGRISLGSSLLALGLVLQSFVPFEGDYPAQLAAHGRSDAARAWVQLGQRAREAGHTERALDRFERALELAPQDGAATYEWAATLLLAADPAHHDPQRAIAALEQWRATGAAATAAPTVRDGIDVLLAAALVEREPGSSSAAARARELAAAVLARTPEHAGAQSLLAALDD
jgi:4-amino-4-deoxy-L-arabinose transferase-like glycosyltransferase